MAAGGEALASAGEPWSHSVPVNDIALSESFAKDIVPICRVCRCESAPNNALFLPCHCTDMMANVHKKCLLEWLRTSRRATCELCGHRFVLQERRRIVSERPRVGAPLRAVAQRFISAAVCRARVALHYVTISVFSVACAILAPMSLFALVRIFAESLGWLFFLIDGEFECTSVPAKPPFSLIFMQPVHFWLYSVAHTLLWKTIALLSYAFVNHLRSRNIFKIKINISKSPNPPTINDAMSIAESTTTTATAATGRTAGAWLEGVTPREYRAYLRRRENARSRGAQDSAQHGDEWVTEIPHELNVRRALDDDVMSVASSSLRTPSLSAPSAGVGVIPRRPAFARESIRCKVCSSSVCILRAHVIEASQNTAPTNDPAVSQIATLTAEVPVLEEFIDLESAFTMRKHAAYKMFPYRLLNVVESMCSSALLTIATAYAPLSIGRFLIGGRTMALIMRLWSVLSNISMQMQPSLQNTTSLVNGSVELGILVRNVAIPNVVLDTVAYIVGLGIGSLVLCAIKNRTASHLQESTLAKQVCYFSIILSAMTKSIVTAFVAVVWAGSIGILVWWSLATASIYSIPWMTNTPISWQTSSVILYVTTGVLAIAATMVVVRKGTNELPVIRWACSIFIPSFASITDGNAIGSVCILGSATSVAIFAVFGGTIYVLKHLASRPLPLQFSIQHQLQGDVLLSSFQNGMAIEISNTIFRIYTNAMFIIAVCVWIGITVYSLRTLVSKLMPTACAKLLMTSAFTGVCATDLPNKHGRYAFVPCDCSVTIARAHIMWRRTVPAIAVAHILTAIAAPEPSKSIVDTFKVPQGFAIVYVPSMPLIRAAILVGLLWTLIVSVSCIAVIQPIAVGRKLSAVIFDSESCNDTMAYLVGAAVMACLLAAMRLLTLYKRGLCEIFARSLRIMLTAVSIFMALMPIPTVVGLHALMLFSAASTALSSSNIFQRRDVQTFWNMDTRIVLNASVPWTIGMVSVYGPLLFAKWAFPSIHRSLGTHGQLMTLASWAPKTVSEAFHITKFLLWMFVRLLAAHILPMCAACLLSSPLEYWMASKRYDMLNTKHAHEILLQLVSVVAIVALYARIAVRTVAFLARKVMHCLV